MGGFCLTKNFASMFAKLLPFSESDIETYLEELINEKVLEIDDFSLWCDRMESDATLSLTRSFVGKKGGDKTAKLLKNFAQAKVQANTENEYEYENDIESDLIL